jgi:ribonuclease HI
MKTVNLTIAGSCTGDPGRGGWAFILRMGEHSRERTGGSPQTTKGQMELNAVIEGLKALRESCQVYLFSDNQHLLDGIEYRREEWRRTLFTRVHKRLPHPLPDGDLWRELDPLADKHQIWGRCIVGHDGHPDMERCEQLAESQARLYAGDRCESSHAAKVAITGNQAGRGIEAEERSPELLGCIDRFGDLELADRGWQIVPQGMHYRIGKLTLIHGDQIGGAYGAGVMPSRKTTEIFQSSCKATLTVLLILPDQSRQSTTEANGLPSSTDFCRRSSDGISQPEGSR